MEWGGRKGGRGEVVVILDFCLVYEGWVGMDLAFEMGLAKGSIYQEGHRRQGGNRLDLEEYVNDIYVHVYLGGQLYRK